MIVTLSGYNVPTRIAPKFGLRVLALFDGSVKMILPTVGKEIKADNSKVMLHLIIPGPTNPAIRLRSIPVEKNIVIFIKVLYYVFLK